MIDLQQVKVDLDRAKGEQPWSLCKWGVWAKRAAWSLEALSLRVDHVEVEETKNGYHARLHLLEALPSPAHLVAVQAILGSDHRREALNLARDIRGEPRDWNTLSRAKVRDGKVDHHLPRENLTYTLCQRLREAGVLEEES